MCGVEHAVAVSSGTAALHLAVLALGIGQGDEVLVPAYTFPATANVVALAGARPVLVDVDPKTMNLDPGARLRRGHAADARRPGGAPLRPAARLGGAAERGAAGRPPARGRGRRARARWRGMPCGGLGELGCLSFHPRKIVSTGEGGAVTTKARSIADAVRRLRHHGIATDGGFEIAEPGFNYRLSDVLCAIGLVQLRRLDELSQARERLAKAYAERLDGDRRDAGAGRGRPARLAGLRRPSSTAATGARGAARAGDRGPDRHLRAPPLARVPRPGPFPGADSCFERALALPFHSRLTETDLDRVAEVLTEL